MLPSLSSPHYKTILRTLLAVVFVSQTAIAQDYSLQPVYGTGDLDGGFVPDPYVIEVSAGGHINIESLGNSCVGFIESDQPSYDLNYETSNASLGFFIESAIDTTLVINDPAGNWYCNDDADLLSDANPGINFENPLRGNYNIWVASYSELNSTVLAKLAITEYGQASWADLDIGSESATMTSTSTVEFGDDASSWANDDECDDPRFQGQGMAGELNDADLLHDATDCRGFFERGLISLVNGPTATLDSRVLGRLDSSDLARDDGSYYDSYTLTGTAGEIWVIDLSSSEFDTYLEVLSPNGEQFANDDFENTIDRSLLSLTLSETGTYQVVANSFGAGETGNYSLNMTLDSAQANGDQQYTGQLQQGDDTFTDGEYFDTYSFNGRPGQFVNIELSSNDFDTYLVLRSPNGDSENNDDAESSQNSLISRELTEIGSYEVVVTSYGPEETGSYSLTIGGDETNTSTSISSSSRDLVNLDLERAVQAELTGEDNLSSDNNYEDIYAFNASTGDTLSINMTSIELDTFLRVITPEGDIIENDDLDGDTSQSEIQVTVREGGRFRITATSYGEEETGSYRILVNENHTPSITQPALSSGDGQIYGVFAGIADYPGTDSDLPLTDQDARRARDALINGAGMNPNNATTLLNSDATMANFEAALGRIGAVAGPDDTLVIFYSGHGGRLERPDGPDSKDPDGMDETIVLYDQQLTDDRLAQMLEAMNVGKVLLVMDSCFSGGFSKDVVSVPGRMGLFSSEEDVLSQVASKFQAGGYLSVFFEEALTQPYADRDDNGELTAIELSQYLHDRFRADVKSFGTDEYVRASGPQANYQRLVVDRGGVGPYNVLFTKQ
ncbi:MAG: hypothetical protein ACI9WR_000715 [Paracoccaceae bacterium]|jgi:hypothetical protein